MTNAMKHRTARIARRVYRAALVAVLIVAMLLTAPVAMAAKKKEEAAPTKSYVLPYFIVMMLVGVGLMTVCRPGSRKDKVDEKKRNEAE